MNKYLPQRNNIYIFCREVVFLGYIIALISGALMSIQGVFNTEVTKTAGMWVTNSFVQLSAFLVCIIAWFVTGRENIGKLFEVDHKYMLLGGVIGAAITYTVIKSVGNLGPARSALVIIISQLFVAYLIELFGLFGMEKQPFLWKKAIGIAIAVIGFIIFRWNEK
ncbi:MAG: DMT family transporter [Lachnospiraceae bacterium]|nr:DMT family transporter [Lachnospiraceae bacterium]